jgi:PAS domain S-box-containing protein
MTPDDGGADAGDGEEKLLRSAALQTANSILLARRRAEQELIQAREALERRTEELARSLSMMRATLESTTDGILVTDGEGRVTGFNGKFAEMWKLSAEDMASAEHRPLLRVMGQQFADPPQFRRRVDEILAASPPESYDRLEPVDGRTVERFSKVQRIEERNAGRVWSFRDITERRSAEAKLREQSEWFRVTLGSIGDAVITVDMERRVTFLNPVAETLTGWPVAEAIGKTLAEVLRIVDETTREPADNPIDRALVEGIVVGLSNHTTLLCRNGPEIPIEDSAAPIKDPAGAIIGAVMVFHDVRERRQKELALARSEQRFRLLGEVVPQLLWTADAQGELDYCNERWIAYTGQTLEQARGFDWTAAVHPDDCARTVETWMRSVQNGEPCEVEYRLRGRDGEYRWFVARSVALRDDEGRVVRWYGSCTDFHQQKLTAEALHEEYTITEQLHEVAKALARELDLGKVVQIITDAGTRITRAQFGAFFYHLLDEKGASHLRYALSGVSREAFDAFPMPRGAPLSGLAFRGEGVLRLDDVRADSRFGRDSPFHGGADGPAPVASYLSAPVISRSGEVLGGLFFGHAEPGVFTARDEKIIVGVAAQAAAAMDTARLYQAEQQARAASEQANKAKDHFLAALSHELRTPLTPVLAILSSLRQESAIPEALAEDLETVRRNVELEARLIDDLLDLTRITSGKLELHRERAPVGRLIEDAINTCLPDLKHKRLSLVRHIEEPQQHLLADSARITQILWNLLKNSIKFTPEGGSIVVRARRAVGPDGAGHATISVQDNGIGIDPTHLHQVFDAFDQGDRRITRQFGGLGLGLAISKAIAEAHRGSLAAYSAGMGGGSTFTLTLPVHGPAEFEEFAPASPPSVAGSVAAAGAASAMAPPGIVHRPLRILLVEDHADTAAILVRLLRRMGHDVLHAGGIAAALVTAQEEMRGDGIDFVLSDLGLPDGSGIELMRELSGKYHLRGIALSGFGMESDIEQSRAAGFARHLIKPIDIAVLRSAIAEVMQGV